MAHPAGVLPPPRGDRTMVGDALRRLRVDLAARFRWAARHGLAEGIRNHFSAVELDLPGQFLPNANRLASAEITDAGLSPSGFYGNVAESQVRTEATAFQVHAELDGARQRARAVFDTHVLRASPVPRP